MGTALCGVGGEDGVEAGFVAGDEADFPREVGGIHYGGIKTKGSHHAVHMACVSDKVDAIIG